MTATILTDRQKAILLKIALGEKVEAELGTDAAADLYDLRSMCLIRYGYAKRWELTPEGVAEVEQL